MNIESLMTSDVVTVAPDTPLKEVAALLSAKRISGVPVCDESGAVVGVISEADIIRKEQGLRTGRARVVRWLTRVFDRELDKVEASTAFEAMTAPALTVRPFSSVSKAARLMIEHGVNRLPVVVNGKLVGIVTRADLVRAFHRSDAELAEEIRDEVFVRALWLAPDALDLTVRDGVATIKGTVDTESDARVAEQLVRRIPGVVEVSAELQVRETAHPERRGILEFFPR